METFCGSLPYTAPEILRGEYYNGPEIDIWSLGVLLYVMVTGKFPFSDPSVQENYNKIMDGDFDLDNRMSLNLKTLLVMMLEPDIEKRLTIEQVLSHKWLQTSGDESVDSSACCELHHERKRESKNNSYVELDYPIKINVAKETSICLEIPVDDVLKKINNAILDQTDGPSVDLELQEKNESLPVAESNDIEVAKKSISMRRLHGRQVKKRVKVINSPIVSLYYLIDSQINKRKWLTSAADTFNNNSDSPNFDAKNANPPEVDSQKLSNESEIPSPETKNIKRFSFKRSFRNKRIFSKSVPDIVERSQNDNMDYNLLNKSKFRNSEHNLVKVANFFSSKNFKPGKMYLSESLKPESIFEDTRSVTDDRSYEFNGEIRCNRESMLGVGNDGEILSEQTESPKNMNISKYSMTSMIGLLKNDEEVICKDQAFGYCKKNSQFREYKGEQIRAIKALDGISDRIVLSEKTKKYSPIEVMKKIEDLLKFNQISYKYADYVLYPSYSKTIAAKLDEHGNKIGTDFKTDFDFLGPLWKSQAELNKSFYKLDSPIHMEEDSDILRMQLIAQENEYLEFNKMNMKQKIKALSSFLLPQAINDAFIFKKQSSSAAEGQVKDGDDRNGETSNRGVIFKNGKQKKSLKRGKKNRSIKKSKNSEISNHHQSSIPEDYVWTKKWVRGKNRVVMAHISEIEEKNCVEQSGETANMLSKYSQKISSLVGVKRSHEADLGSLKEKIGQVESSIIHQDIDSDQKVIMVPVSYCTTQLVGQLSPSLNFKKESEVMEHYSCSFKLELVLIHSVGFYKKYAIIVTRTSGHVNKFNLFRMFLKRMIVNI
ncbi:Serine/threonine-protein kinase SIK2 [Smittium mucronatum]|uniref:Serine/threonine-protein kinase SIK2 n=1 Tax=Smittium mucronatum TaxID=133383 RepID=A0A1R0GSS5_9FUNG|nr:Serine/threonine-protein kinase SIK2 [Smittium mucronatum]